MSFITSTDLLTAMYQEQLDAITREDDALPQFGMDAAEEEMKGYLSPKYDVAKIFAKSGTDRNKLLIVLCRDMAIYHILSISNPGMNTDSKKARYDRAVSWLQNVQSGKVNPPNLERTETDETIGEILMTSNVKRTQHY
jgi:phage gp36-like protein